MNINNMQVHFNFIHIHCQNVLVYIKYQIPEGKLYLLVGSSLVVLSKFWMSLCITYTQQNSLGWRHLTVIFFICFPRLYFTIVKWITKRLQDGQLCFLILSTTFTFKYIIVFYILKRTENLKQYLLKQQK